MDLPSLRSSFVFNDDIICASDVAQLVALDCLVLVRSQNTFLALDICDLEVSVLCRRGLLTPIGRLMATLAALIGVFASALERALPKS